MTTFHSAGALSAELLARLATRTVALGAETDLGRKVYHGKRTVDATQVPCCSLLEGDDLSQHQGRLTEYLIEQRFAVLAYVPCNDEAPNTAAHAAIRDIKRALFVTDGRADGTMGGKVRRTTYLGRQIAPRADGERFVLVVVEFSCEYVENVASP
jgi:hypothetical protein